MEKKRKGRLNGSKRQRWKFFEENDDSMGLARLIFWIQIMHTACALSVSITHTTCVITTDNTSSRCVIIHLSNRGAISTVILLILHNHNI